MAPIEVLFGALVLVFGFIGVTRGFLRELGVTMVMMFVLFFLSLFEPLIDRLAWQVVHLGLKPFPPEAKSLVECGFVLLVIAAAAFVSYEGETLSFGGEPPRGIRGPLLGLLTGLLNGYLIAGSLWYYMHLYDYPIAVLGFSGEGLSGFARGLLPFLPTAFLGQPVLLGQSMLLYLSALLLLARVIR